MAVNYECGWWTDTEKMTEYIDGISSVIYRNNDTGLEASSRNLPIGALYVTRREPNRGPNDHPPVGLEDGLAIVCKMSDHTWYIDSRASNCTKPDDYNHRCWVRHGSIGQRLTVDKNGLTCAAGAGSVYMNGKNWHGFLRDGRLVQA